MKKLVHEKARAAALRKKGFSYNEILKKVPVAKSSLSLWLKDLPLTRNEKEAMRRRQDANISKGRIRAVATNKQRRLKENQELFVRAKEEFHTNIIDPLFAVGVALYWAEGAKRSTQFQFCNSDPDMIMLMVAWIEDFLRIPRSKLAFRLYIHKPYAHENWEKEWAHHIGVSAKNFKKTVYKPTGLLIKKRHNYMGCLRIEVPKSAVFLRKIVFWQHLLVEYHGLSRYAKSAPVV